MGLSFSLQSQRVTDVILRCFQACAASQGDTNNLTFGFGGNMPGETETKGFGYYETIAGGSGAGPTWEGTSGVHTHMTNTRITDAEVFERRYPVILQEFSLRPNSGGNGQHRGGDGVVRDIEFRIPVQVSILSERRVYHPYGLEGGEDAQCGQNIWARRVKKQDGGWETRYINLGAKNSVQMQAGERIIIRTPGGGGWGQIGDQSQLIQEEDHRRAWRGGSIANNTATQEASM
jgi:5-oxoprolinase (ATP-hydrolysing)